MNISNEEKLKISNQGNGRDTEKKKKEEKKIAGNKRNETEFPSRGWSSNFSRH